MSTQTKSIKEPIDELTDEKIQLLKNERTQVGAISCEVVIEGGHKYLVTQYPPVSEE